MKRSFLVLIAVAVALLAAAIAPLFRSDPGLVRIHLLGWTLETTVLVLVLGLLLLWLVLHLLLRLWRMPAETARRVRERRALHQLEKGLLALSEGDWQTAERALEKSASSHGPNTARYLAAAEAAGGQEAEDRAEWYLEQADSRKRKQRFLVDLTRARILVENGKYEEAQPVLEGLQQQRRKHPQVLELLARCYEQGGEWRKLEKLLPQMLNAGVVSQARGDELRTRVAIGAIRKCGDAEALKSAWSDLPIATKALPDAMLAFAEQAIAIGVPEINEEILRKALNREWHSRLLIPYGEPGPGDRQQRLKQGEKWLRDHPDDPWLHLVLGRLCAQEELWGKARQYMIQSLEIEPTVAGYDSLGQLLERKGELEVAMACFRNALRMNQGKEPLPLPQEQARLTTIDATGSSES